ncbi:MAG: RNA polymerase sigma factor [Phycisphaerales bacterium JB037]
MGLALKVEPPANPFDEHRVRGLVDAASRGDAEAWRMLVEAYSGRLFALVRSRCGSRELAEEITQSVFVTLAEKLGTGLYQEQGRFESWLFRIAINRIRDEMRRTRRHATPTDPVSFEFAGPTREDSRADPDRLTALREAVAELSDAEQEVIHLRHHAELSFKQIAELLGEPLGTLLARHHRALKKLQTRLTSATPSSERGART